MSENQAVEVVGSDPMVALLARIEASASPADTVPDGFKTRSEWAALWNKSGERAGELLRRAVASGIMERRDFRVKVGTCGVRPVPHYAEIKAQS